MIFSALLKNPNINEMMKNEMGNFNDFINTAGLETSRWRTKKVHTKTSSLSIKFSYLSKGYKTLDYFDTEPSIRFLMISLNSFWI